MNALEAAIELLKDARRALSAEDLARMAVERKLVARAAARALDKQLSAEADADDGRVVKTDGGYTLRKAKAKAAPKKGAKPDAKADAKTDGKKPAAKGKAAPARKPEAKPEPKAEARSDARPARGRGKKATEAPTGQETLALPSEATTPPGSLVGFAPAPGAIEPAPLEDSELADDDEDALHERIAVEAAEVADSVTAAGPTDAPTAEMSDEEKALADLYQEDLSGRPAKVHGEYQDQRTADEDRPMLPEINAREERNKRWEQRRDERRRRRDEDRQRRQGGGRDNRGPAEARTGDRPDAARGAAEARPTERPETGDRGQPGGDRNRDRDRDRDRDRGPRPVEARPERPVSTEIPVVAATEATPTTGNGAHVAHRVGNTLGDATWTVLSQLRSTQPMPVRQIAQMMRKRGMIEAEPEQIWPHLKAALLGDERSYRTLGLRPRIVYRGRDLFAVGPVAQSATAGAEAGLASALSQLAVATHKVLKERIARASQGGFERLVHAYLVAIGYQDIDWIKRVPGISYGTAMPPDGGSQILVSARSGDSPVDRRGVGELRVGVEAKGYLSGLLIAARELSDDAERELERPGRSIAVLTGDAFVGSLLGSGVGVVTAAAPIRYVDDQLLDELLAG